MRILGIDSSSLVASVALVEEDKLLAEYTVNFKKTHSQTLLPMLDEIIRMTDTDLETLDAIAISSGPGSFTGLRIGAATAKGLGLALQKPLIGVPTLEATAYNIFATESSICPIMDARRNQVYNGIYQFIPYGDSLEQNFNFITISKPRALDIMELIEELNRFYCKGKIDYYIPDMNLHNLNTIEVKRVIFLGDGVPVYQEQLSKNLQIPYTFAPAHINHQRASAVARLGREYFKQGKFSSSLTLEYLRKSQAEREKDLKKEHLREN